MEVLFRAEKKKKNKKKKTDFGQDWALGNFGRE